HSTHACARPSPSPSTCFPRPGRSVVGTRVLASPAYTPEASGHPYDALLCSALERHGARVDEFTPWRVLRGGYDVWHLHRPERVANERRPLRRALAFVALVAIAR